MKRKEAAQHVGTYGFVVVKNGRSFPCNILRVTRSEVVAQETDHDEWPYTVRAVPLAEVAWIFSGTEADQWTVDEGNFMKKGAAQVFTYLRGQLNEEDLLARPLAQGAVPEIPGALLGTVS